MFETALWMPTDVPVSELAEVARLADEEGYDYFLVPDEGLTRDVFVALTAVALLFALAAWINRRAAVSWKLAVIVLGVALPLGLIAIARSSEGGGANYSAEKKASAKVWKPADPRPVRRRICSSAQRALRSRWQPLQAFGTPIRSDRSGRGTRKLWSRRGSRTM